MLHDNKFAAKKHEVKGTFPLVSKRPGAVAEHYLTHFRPDLICYNDDFFDWKGSGYALLDPKQVHADVIAIYDGYPVASSDGGSPQAWSATASAMNSVMQNIKGRTHLSKTDFSIPGWLDGRSTNLGDYILFQNGVLNIATGELHDPDRAFFSTNVLPFKFDQSAIAMPNFQAFLEQLFAHDPGARDLLQEWFGYNLISSTSHQKLMLIVGPRRAGKGTLGRLLERLVGTTNFVSPKLKHFGETFGSQQLIGKLSAVVSEARTNSRDNKHAIVENLLSIVGEDPQSIDRKNTSAWQGRLSVRITLMSNEVPDLPDHARALEARYLIIRLNESFVGKEDRNLEQKLISELPAIMNWALDGLRRLRANGTFSKSDDYDIRDLVIDTPLRQFVADRCILSPTARCDKQSLFSAYKSWCTENESPISQGMQLQHFSRRLLEEFPEIRGVKNRKSEYQGIQLLPNSHVPF